MVPLGTILKEGCPRNIEQPRMINHLLLFEEAAGPSVKSLI